MYWREKKEKKECSSCSRIRRKKCEKEKKRGVFDRSWSPEGGFRKIRRVYPWKENIMTSVFALITAACKLAPRLLAIGEVAGLAEGSGFPSPLISTPPFSGNRPTGKFLWHIIWNQHTHESTHEKPFSRRKKKGVDDGQAFIVMNPCTSSRASPPKNGNAWISWKKPQELENRCSRKCRNEGAWFIASCLVNTHHAPSKKNHLTVTTS